MEYLLLSKGQVIWKEDEYLNDDCLTWSPVDKWEVGMFYDADLFVPMRRGYESPRKGSYAATNYPT